MTRSRVPFLGLTVLAGAALWVACSGGGESTSSSSSSSSGGAASGSTSSSGAASSSGAGNGSSSGGGNGSTSGGGNGSSSGGNNASSSGGGNGSSSGFQFDAAGFENVDAGFAPYQGEPEPGVKCGRTDGGFNVCSPDAGEPVCCLDFFSGGTSCTSDTCPGFGSVAVRCDGPEDCDSAQVCCFQGIGGASCVANGGCQSGDLTYQLCNVDSDCPQGWGCCYSQTLAEYTDDIDVGACVEGCGQ
ncbi:MAG: hypothetical protein AB2A00_32440 [Myxococcota bacterium]